MFRYKVQDLLSKAQVLVYPIPFVPDDGLEDIRAEYDVLHEQFQECTTPEQFQQCLQKHMFNDPWSWTIFPYFNEYEQSGSKDPVEIELEDGYIIKCNVIF